MKNIFNIVIIYNIHRYEARWKSHHVLGLSNEKPCHLFIVTSSCLKVYFYHGINMLDKICILHDNEGFNVCERQFSKGWVTDELEDNIKLCLK